MYDMETIRENIKKSRIGDGLTFEQAYGLDGEEGYGLVKEDAVKLDNIDKIQSSRIEKVLILLEEYIGIKEPTPEQLLAFHYLINLIQEGKFNI